MTTRYLITMLFALTLFGCGEKEYKENKQDQVKESSEPILVPITFAIKASNGGFGGEWVGKLDLNDYENFIKGEISNKLLVFYEVYYVDPKGNKIKNSDTKGANGQVIGYSDTVYVRSDIIIRVMSGFDKKVIGGKVEIHYNPGIYDYSSNVK